MLKGNLRKEFDKFPWINDKKIKSLEKRMTDIQLLMQKRELYD